MPPGIQRINAKRSQPNDRIVFIKPLKGPDEKIAQDFLERIAAQCVPIMREHHLSVTSLEEYEPNPEFVGRNFNAGEVIQLVLKSRSGHWLPFHYVQMVMMHELAHCKQMNHSRAFWAVRNRYAEQMRALWARGFTGEGLWGRGALLSTGEFEKKTAGPEEPLPEHLCGGTYRSRPRKRKAKPALSHKERRERRILKRFGANGVALGEDAATKKKLEGKAVATKPRVAASARGRELRAAAALARFEQQKAAPKKDEVEEEEQEEEKEKEVIELSDTDSGSDCEDDDAESGAGAVDINGKRLLDSKGRGMIKVCEDENPDDQDAQDELRELRSIGSARPAPKAPDLSGPKPDAAGGASRKPATQKKLAAPAPASSSRPKPEPTRSKDPRPPPRSDAAASLACSACTFANEPGSTRCAVCGNALGAKGFLGSWACASKTCRGSQYRNAGDCGVCGVCGERRPSGGGGA
ncbi:hypothetical protein VTJ83DRAFT_2295 [Remersonia thermophila]|uniref:WLM domain-containing protein n=1 Tax=Remersonia thermophila TaxID=72144 RepID=A0ABR4DJT6_9PEZI